MRKASLASRRLRLGMLAGVLLMALGGDTLADVVVMSRDVPGIKHRTVLMDSDVIEVPAGKTLHVMLQSGKTFEIRGPRKGRIADLVEPTPVHRKLWDTVKKFVAEGGIDRDRTTGSRGRPELLLDDVPLSEQTTVCIERGARPRIVRAPGEGAVVVRVVDNSQSKEAEVRLSGGGQGADWPTGIALKDKQNYLLFSSGKPSIEVTVRLLDRTQLSGSNILVELDRLGCAAQVAIWLGKQLSSN